MTREEIAEIISGIDDRHVSAAAHYAPPGHEQAPERIRPMRMYRVRKPFVIAAAVVLVLALGITASAAGWISPIFHRLQTMSTVKTHLYTAAEQYMNDSQPEPETVTLPEFDNSRVSLSERYYDGTHLLLGVNLEEIVPDIVVGYTPDATLLEQINAVAFFSDVTGNDNLDDLLEQGMDRAIYEDYLANRTKYAKEYDFRNLSAIEFDWYLQRKLTPEAYEAAWQTLRETGRLCVVDNSVYIGDHIVLDDGTDLGPTGQQNLDSTASDAHSGNLLIELDDLPKSAQNQDALKIHLNLKNGRTYYYMELGKSAYFHYETAGESSVAFLIENATADTQNP